MISKLSRYFFHKTQDTPYSKSFTKTLQIIPRMTWAATFDLSSQWSGGGACVLIFSQTLWQNPPHYRLLLLETFIIETAYKISIPLLEDWIFRWYMSLSAAIQYCISSISHGWGFHYLALSSVLGDSLLKIPLHLLIPVWQLGVGSGNAYSIIWNRTKCEKNYSWGSISKVQAIDWIWMWIWIWKDSVNIIILCEYNYILNHIIKAS